MLMNLCRDHNGKRQSQIPPSEPTHMSLLPVKDVILMRRLEVGNRDLLKYSSLKGKTRGYVKNV
jgi:hypothetical protein